MNITGRDGFIIGCAIDKVIEHLETATEETILGRDRRQLAHCFESLMGICAEADESTEPPLSFMEMSMMALYLAIRFEQAKPKRDQRWSDMQDMKAILLHHGRDDAIHFMKHDEAAGIRPADLINERGQPNQLN